MYHPIKILVAGHTGLNKLDCLEKRIIPEVLSRNEEWKQAQSVGKDEECERIRQRVVKVLRLEANFNANSYEDMYTDHFRRLWVEALGQLENDWRALRKDWSGKKAEQRYVFVLAHLTLQNSSQFCSPLAFTSIQNDKTKCFPLFDFLTKQFQPDFVISLIDEVYQVKARLGSPNHFRLIELLRWRNIETLFADYLMESVERAMRTQTSGRYRFLRSPVFALRQPVKSLVDYISKPDLPRVYLSFPISRPLDDWIGRSDDSGIVETNHFRSFFAEHTVAFDPLTINERPLHFAVSKFKETQERIHSEQLQLLELCSSALASSDLASAGDAVVRLRRLIASSDAHTEVSQKIPLGVKWPINIDKSITPDEVNDGVLVDRLEVEEVITRSEDSSEVNHQIVTRDYRLIDQSDCVVCYRPTRGRKDWSRGTEREGFYARGSAKQVIVIADRGDTFSGGPFATPTRKEDLFFIDDARSMSSRADTFAKVLERIRSCASDIRKRKLR